MNTIGQLKDEVLRIEDPTPAERLLVMLAESEMLRNASIAWADPFAFERRDQLLKMEQAATVAREGYDAVCVERDRLQRRLNAMIACVKAVERSIKDVISALEREGGKLTGPIEFELRSAAKFAFGIHHDAENR